MAWRSRLRCFKHQAQLLTMRRATVSILESASTSRDAYGKGEGSVSTRRQRMCIQKHEDASSRMRRIMTLLLP